MALVLFTLPGQDGPVYVRADGILSLSGVFAWSPTVDARTLSLTTGQTVLVDDTDENVRAAVASIGTTQDADNAVIQERARRLSRRGR